MIPGPVEFSIHQPMRSAHPDTKAVLYEKLPGLDGTTWIIEASRKNPDAIYVDNPRNREGFGGAEFSFTLTDGSVFKSKGPWKTGADPLLKETGVDLTALYPTKGIIALRRESQGWERPDLYFDVLHVDEAPVVGLFDRVEFMAQQLANDLGQTVRWAVVSNGGGCASWKNPGPLSEGHVLAIVKDALLTLDLPQHIEKMLTALRDVRAADAKAARR